MVLIAAECKVLSWLKRPPQSQRLAAVFKKSRTLREKALIEINSGTRTRHSCLPFFTRGHWSLNLRFCETLRNFLQRAANFSHQWALASRSRG